MATIGGTAGADVISGTSKSDQISAGDGDDTVAAGNGNDTVYGGAGNDWINGEEGNDILDGGSGNDTILGGEGNDTIYGGDGDDVIDGGQGNDKIYAGAGNDRIIASYDNDTIDGGSGTDLFDASVLNSGLTVNLATGQVRGPDNTSITGVENVTGTHFADLIIGDAGANVLAGNGGNDALYGGAGNDTLIAAPGNSFYSGDSGDDKLVFTVGTTGVQSFSGGTGTDTVEIVLNSAQLNAVVVSELVAYSAFAANPLTAALPFQFSAIGNLSVRGAEVVSVVIDGQTVSLDSLLNQAPVVDAASSSSLSVAHNATVSGAVVASDANGDTLTYSLGTGPANGAVTLNAATGQFVYAAGNHVGNDTFTVLVDDGKGGIAEHSVAVTLTNEAPVITSDSDVSLTVGHGKAIEGNVGATDGDGDTYAFSIASGPEHGTLVFTDDTGTYVYTADDYVGWDSFTVRVSDGHGGFAEHTVSVNSTNQGPNIDTANSTSFVSAYYDTSASGRVMAADADGDAVSFTLKSGPAHGSVHVDADGRFTFNAADFAGTDSFVVTASDGHGGTADHTVNLGVIGTLDATPAATAVNINLGTGAATGVEQSKLAWAVNVIGSMFNDLIYGDARANVLKGGAGKDELHGAQGNDRVDGGIGDDKLFGEDGNDILSAGDGVDSLNGGAGNDVMSGGAGNDGFFGGGGDDRIVGDSGNDRMYGDGGNDIMQGGAGSDIMTGAGFNNGGARGANTYVWAAGDVLNPNGTSTGLDHITDFGAGDKLDFTGLVPSHAGPAHDVVRVTDTASGLVVAVDMGGTAGFVDVVVLDNVHGMSIDDLDHNGAVNV